MLLLADIWARNHCSPPVPDDPSKRLCTVTTPLAPTVSVHATTRSLPFVPLNPGAVNDTGWPVVAATVADPV
jgi:hypothetical protein